MAGSVNKVILVGNLGRDPEVRHTQDGKPIVNLSLATSESWRDRNTGEPQERTEWHRVVIFDVRLVDVAEQYLKKGSKVYLEGELGVVALGNCDDLGGRLDFGTLKGRNSVYDPHRRPVGPTLVQDEGDACPECLLGSPLGVLEHPRLVVQLCCGEMGVGVHEARESPEPVTDRLIRVACRLRPSAIHDVAGLRAPEWRTQDCSNGHE